MFVDFNILNQLGSPSINSNTFANRPAAGQTGRLFVSTDTFEIYRDNGTTWDLIGGPGSSTITGTGTATQVAYFTSSQAIGSSANLFWDNTNTRLGIGTATPGAALDIHSTGTIAQFNTTSATGNTYIAFQRTGTGVWRMGDNYSAGNNFFELHNTALATDALQVAAATNKTSFQATQTYTTGLARGNYFDYNLSVSAGGTFSSPNAITALGASLDLTLAGNATIPSGARSGLDAYNSIAFTGAGTLTHGQGSQIRAYSNLTAGWAFNGSATGTVTHLAGLRALFPDNTGSAINVTNNYALLLNDQTANTGTVTYTNRWGVYQEGASDLNYMAANLLLGSTTNTGEKLQVTGTAKVSSTLTAQILAVNTDGQTVTISSNYDLLTEGKNIFIGGGGNSVTIDDDVINGSYHTAVGVEALFSNTYGTSNTAIGYRSLYTNDTGSNNTAIGNSSQLNSGGTDNTSVGSASLYANTTGFSNTAIGSQSLQYNTEGIFNNSLGYYALNSNTLGNNNTAIGVYSVEYNSTGSDNIGIGYQAGKYFGTTSALTTCNSSVFIGNTTKASANNNTNEIVIGHTAVGNGSNSVTLGNSSITKTILRGNTLIGTTTSTYTAERLQVSGDINVYNSVGGGVYSNADYKQANLNAGGVGLYMEDFTSSGSDYHQVKLYSNAAGEQVIFLATVGDDAKNTLIYLGDYNGLGFGTVMIVDDINKSVNFNSPVGKYQFGSVPQFANNAAAIAAGYPAGYIYRITGTGDLKIVI
jgi:hypothetical protein